ncbi:Tyrocidine synthase 3 [Streptomyces sp. enrichment culture]|uniref:amino acid adenylation domain-containing protein n=1 Tax=Streptomyces sp. enrichment culture TaxID=1795815 RepID=UPI003F56B71C
MGTGSPGRSRTDELRAELLRRRLAGRRPGTPAAPTPPAAPAGRSGPLPLSAGQRQMWFHHRMHPDSDEYLVTLALRLTGRLDRPALERAWDGMIERHGILRTRHRLLDGTPVQVIDPPRAGTLVHEDLAGLPPARRESAVRERVEHEGARPMDLERAWPVRGTLLRCADDEHVLVLVVHHIACDSWATGVFAQELGELYRSATTGTGASLPDATQYAEYARWENERAERGAFDRHLAYWRAQLAGLAPLDLPADRRRPAVRGDGAGTVGRRVPDEVASAVRRLAARAGTTPFTVLLAAFQALLSRYTGRTDVAVGTVSSLRTRPEWQRMLGYGANSLVVRSRWTGDPSFARLVDDVRRTVLDAFDHQELPFQLLVAELEPERDLSRTPLFQTLFTLRPETVTDYGLPGVTSAPVLPPRARARCDVSLVVDEAPDGAFTARLEYATDLFDRATGARMLDQYLRLLGEAVARPDAPLSALDLLDGDDRARLTAAPVVHREARTLHEAFARQAARTPGAVAVSYGAERLTYAELDARAERIAALLRTRGARTGTRVAVLLERGTELLPALLGILKSGAAYVPLDPASPDARLELILDDLAATGTPLVLTDGEHRPRLPERYAGTPVLTDGDEPGPARPAGPAAHPDDPAYVIYTSGSTGRPKGVEVTHRSVHRLMETVREHLDTDGTDVWTLFHSHAFDVSVFEMWGPLLRGGRLVVVPLDTARSPGDLLDLLVGERVTVLSQTPTAFRGLVALAADDDPRLGRLALRAVVCGGEQLPVQELGPWFDRVDPDRTAVLNLYGITETTVHATCHRVTRADVGTGAGNPVGRPLADLAIQLLDARGEPVPAGVPGEMYVSGPGVALGYLGRPGPTAERFVPDPFGPPGSRRYRSGDLARRRTDGGLEYLGRIDDQVKIRGFRVEPGEVETVLAAHPGVRQAAVVAREDGTAGRRLVGYVVPVPGTAVDPVELRRRLRAALPEYMVPAALVPLDALPLTGNGKLDRRALPAPGAEAAGPAPGRAPLAPRTAAEREFASVWCEVLELTDDRLGVEDSFFDLGGDSIRAVTLVGALRGAGYDVTIRDVFDHRTIAGMCAAVAERAPAGADTAVRPFELLDETDRERLPAGLVDAYPMTRIQVGMVIDMIGHGRHNTYQNVATTRIREDEPFSLPSLHAAAQAVARRHDVLRTSFDLHSCSVPVQLVHASAEVPVEVRDLRGLDEEAVLADLHRFHDADRARVFDLTRPPMLRLTAHLTDDGWWLSASEFHGIVEGWSYHSLLRELLESYRSLRARGEPAPFTDPGVRFADSVAAELRALSSPEARAYWDRAVREQPAFTLPPGWGEPGLPREDFWESVPFDDLEDKLRALAADAGASLKSVLVAAYGVVLGLLGGGPRFTAGVVVHTRPETAGSDRVYGVHLNTVPFVFRRPSGTWRDLVRTTFDQEAGLWPHRQYPMPRMQEDNGGERLVHVVLNHVDFARLESDAVDMASVMAPGKTEFDLAVTTVSRRISLKTNTTVLTRERARRLVRLLRRVLEAMAADPGGRADSVFPEPDEELLTARVNDTVREVPPVSVLRSFETAAARRPDAVAVVRGARRVSYASLDARAERIARALPGRGPGAGGRVAVLLDRGPDLLAALLAVWKAGAAYVPLDPSWPAARIASVTGAAGVSAAVTSTAYADRFGGVDTVLVDGLPDAPAGGPRPERADDLDAPAYVIFTSGSTGVPKGVEVTHRSLADHVAWAVRELASRGTGGAPLFSSVAFDLVVPNLWAPLVTGQAVHTVGQDAGPADLAEELAAGAPYGFVKLTPGHLDLLAAQLTPAQAAALAPVLVVAGEPLHPATVRRWRALAPDTRLINEYGPTETCVGATVHEVPRTLPDHGVVPIGTPLPNTTVHVLDELMRPVLPGVPGELYVGGAGVARGYVGRPDLTAERFVPDPYGPPGTRLYRTGDRVRQRPDGVLEFLGRLDDQAKIRGHRVEPGEVRAVLAGHPGVRDAYVTVHEGELAAYVVPALPDDLAGYLAERLPEYLVPAAFTALAELPLNANGKVDRAALPAPRRPGGPADDAFAAPRTATERRIARIWREVLGVERVGVRDGFADLGGHSLKLISVIAEARRTGLPLTLRMLYEYGTLEELAAAVDALPVGRPEPVRPEPARHGALPSEPAPALALDERGLLAAMTEHRVPGAAVALLRDGAVVSVRGYGVTTAGGTEPVTARTPFRVGSVSKHVTTLAVLSLVRRGVLNLDADANGYLSSWRTPGRDPVSVRDLLSHQSGLSRVPVVHYRPTDTIPTVPQILRGLPPADHPAVDVERPPGREFRKSSVNFSVLELLLQDVTGEDFPDLMRRLVFEPLGMTDSSYDQWYPRRSPRPAATGHRGDGTPLPGGWRVRAEAAAGGLWSSAADLARVAAEIRRARLGDPGARLLTRPLAQQMLTVWHPGSFYGLGTVVDGTGGGPEYGHGGRTAGFRAGTFTRVDTGEGFVVLTNSESGQALGTFVADALRRADGTAVSADHWTGPGRDAPLDEDT